MCGVSSWFQCPRKHVGRCTEEETGSNVNQVGEEWREGTLANGGLRAGWPVGLLEFVRCRGRQNFHEISTKIRVSANHISTRTLRYSRSAGPGEGIRYTHHSDFLLSFLNSMTACVDDAPAHPFQGGARTKQGELEGIYPSTNNGRQRVSRGRMHSPARS